MAILTTDRLTLRPLAASDAEAIVRGLNNFAVSKWLARVPYPYGPGDAEWFLDSTQRGGSGIARFAITEAGELAGIISIEDGEMGYWLAEPRWGRGLGKEAARAMVDHAFGTLALDAISAGYFSGNEGSRRILEGLGFVETERGVKYSLAHNAELPHVALNLTRGAWEEAKERR